MEGFPNQQNGATRQEIYAYRLGRRQAMGVAQEREARRGQVGAREELREHRQMARHRARQPGGIVHNFRASSPPGERPSEPPPRPPPSAPRRRNILGDLVEPTPPPRGDSSDEEQEGSGVSVCAFSISTLRKAVTQKRKQERITGAKGRTQLLELLLAHRKLPGVAAAITSEHALDGQNVADLRRNWRKVSAAYHKPVSKMKLPEIIKYMYATAFHLSYDWSDVLQGKDTKKRISAACKDAAQPGQTDGSAPSGALPGKKKAPKKSQTKRAPPQRPESDDNDLDIEDFPQAEAAPRPTYDLEAGRRILERRKQIQARRREEPLTVPARKKRSQPAPKPSSTSSTVRRGLSKLTAEQKQQLAEYRNAPGRNRSTLAKRIQIYMMQGLDFEAARRKAESRNKGEVDGRSVPKARARGKPGRGKRFIDDSAIG